MLAQAYTHISVFIDLPSFIVKYFPQRPRSSQLQLMPVTSVIIKDKQSKNEVSQGRFVMGTDGWETNQPPGLLCPLGIGFGVGIGI